MRKEKASFFLSFPLTCNCKCGHCFHLHCWGRWNGEKCPFCNQQAILFSKIFISAPSREGGPASPAAAKAAALSIEERRELERLRQRAQEDEEDRAVVREMEHRMKEDPEGSRAMMTMMMMVQSHDLRKAEEKLLRTQDTCETAQGILGVTQSDLEEATAELKELKPKYERTQAELDRLKRVRWESATQRGEKHKQQLKALQDKVDRYKDKYALTKRQLARRNKELIVKRKLISAHKLELAATGKEQERMCKKTKEELQRTKKELELIRELDSMTMGDSMTSFGNGSLIWD